MAISGRRYLYSQYKGEGIRLFYSYPKGTHGRGRWADNSCNERLCDVFVHGLAFLMCQRVEETTETGTTEQVYEAIIGLIRMKRHDLSLVEDLLKVFSRHAGDIRSFISRDQDGRQRNCRAKA